MKAITVDAPGGPEVLRYGDVADPSSAPGQVVIKVEAAGVNYLDIYQRTGVNPVQLPSTPGVEAAGTVLALGDGVDGLTVGDRVAYQGPRGAYAEIVAAPADRVVRIPDGVGTKQAAAAMLQGMTAHYLATSVFTLERGRTCLVHAAAGGVGLNLCQIASHRGARVIGTVSSDEKAEIARRAGAYDVIVYPRQDVAAETRRLTGGHGVDVVYDSVGLTTFESSLRSLKQHGLLVLFGQSSGTVPPIDARILGEHGSLFLTRPNLGHYTATRDELVRRANEVLDWVINGQLSLHIGGEFPLSKAAEAHRQLEGRRTTGKLLLIPDGTVS